MSDITLSSGIRKNLLTLQQTAEMMANTQERLATGRKVNSALDNPTNYFLSEGLNARANDMTSLLDGISNAVQTLQTADKGITAITKLVKSAQSTAKQAKQAGTTSATQTRVQGANAINTDGTSGASVKARAESQTLGTGIGFAAGDSIEISATAANGTTTRMKIDIVAPGGTLGTNELSTDSTIADVVQKINGSAVASARVTDDGRLDITSNSAKTLSVEIDDAADAVDYTASAANFSGGSGTALDLSPANNPSIYSKLGFDQLSDRNGTTSAGAAGGPTDMGGLDVLFAKADPAANEASKLTISSTAGSENSNRAQLVSQFNTILEQIDKLASDASYNGVNLIDSSSTELAVAFNERRDEGKSELKITGADVTSSGLGITKATTMSVADANAKLDELTEALNSVRSTASRFGSHLTTVRVRKDFSKSVINTLKTGANNLVLADTNAEGANLLSLQTRQSLSTTALSLSSQADQAVLRLFR